MSKAEDKNQFGTFGGVFTPSILTILGVIMFMRTGFVTGQAGVRSAILILVIAKGITLLTALSISAVSTNTRVQGGGAYFLISRSLGPSYGGAIGLALFLAQAFSVPFYILGFVEAITTVWPQMQPYFLWIGVASATALYGVNLIGTQWAIRAQYAILTALALSLVVFMGGSLLAFDPAILRENMAPAYDRPELSFWVMFAIFFPAVTGIMAGVNMSGDLKTPSESIPKGTLYAIGVSFVVYLAQIIVTGGAMSRRELIDRPYESLLDHALFGLTPLVVAGVFAATLSSALGSFLGAPRILQALARDRIFPGLFYFSRGSDRGDEPRRGLALTYAMTVGVLIAAGNRSDGGALNVVAAILTMFFLYTYGMTNLAAFIEHVSRNPSFRPRFRFFHWSTALLGALGCLFAALLINPIAALCSFAIILVVFAYVERRVLETTFGDARRGFVFAQLRSQLQRLFEHPPHPKNWRPTALVLSGNPEHRRTLTTYAEWFESGRGIVTLAQIIVGDVHDKLEERAQALAQLESFVADRPTPAFPEVLVAADFDDGLAAMLQTHSIGPIKPNLVVLGWTSDRSRAEPFGGHLRLIQALGKSTVIVVDKGLPERPQRRIDVWWRGRHNGSLMVILAYLVTLDWGWRGAEIRVMRLIDAGTDPAAAKLELEELVDAARIPASVEVVAGSGVREAIHGRSRDATLVFLGVTPPAAGAAGPWYDHYHDLVEGLPTTLLVSSSGDADVFA